MTARHRLIRSTRQSEFPTQRKINELPRAGSHAARTAIGIFGLVAGAVMVAMVGYYGLATSDSAAGGTIAAFWFSVIAIGGIGGPAIAVHLFRAGQGLAKVWGLIAGLVAAVALCVNLSNSLGAIAGRADQTVAKRADAKDARKDLRATLERLTRERAALIFVPATADDVEAAKAAVAAAERVRRAECAKRAPNACRSRETAEQTKRDALARVLSYKAMSDRAARLDQDIAATRARLDTAPAVAAVDPRAELLAKIFPVGVEMASTGQQVATVVVVEILIAFALIAWELLAAPAGGLQGSPTALPEAPLPGDTPKAGPAVRDAGRGGRKAQHRTTRKVDQRKAVQAGPDAGGPAGPDGPAARGPAVRAKAELGIVDQLHKRGGKLDGSSERTLAKRLGTSRSTTRRALHALVAAGVVKIAAGTLLLTAA